MKKYCGVSKFFVGLVALVSTNCLMGAVDDITGNSGGAQTGSITLTGGTSGAVFSGSSSTITQSFNFISFPATTSANGQIIINSDPVLHYYGTSNKNIFVGGFAGNFSTTGAHSTACGDSALNSVTSGSYNTAVGHASLISLTTGAENTAVGNDAGLNITTGGANVLVGAGAGSAYTSAESNNIIIGSNPGVISEDLTIRIGGGQTQEHCYIDGIYGATVDSNDGLAVYVDTLGKLGTIVSSAKFKENITDVLRDSQPIMNLRAVSYILKADIKRRKQFGLIAEEVYKVLPALVTLDKKGEPYAVRYHELPVLLLNELQKQYAHIKNLEDLLYVLLSRIAKLESRLSQ